MTYLKKDVYGFRKSKKALVSAVIATGLFSFGLTPSVAASELLNNVGEVSIDDSENIVDNHKVNFNDLITTPENINNIDNDSISANLDKEGEKLTENENIFLNNSEINTKFSSLSDDNDENFYKNDNNSISYNSDKNITSSIKNNEVIYNEVIDATNILSSYLKDNSISNVTLNMLKKEVSDNAIDNVIESIGQKASWSELEKDVLKTELKTFVNSVKIDVKTLDNNKDIVGLKYDKPSEISENLIIALHRILGRLAAKNITNVLHEFVSEKDKELADYLILDADKISKELKNSAYIKQVDLDSKIIKQIAKQSTQISGAPHDIVRSSSLNFAAGLVTDLTKTTVGILERGFAYLDSLAQNQSIENQNFYRSSIENKGFNEKNNEDSHSNSSTSKLTEMKYEMDNEINTSSSEWHHNSNEGLIFKINLPFETFKDVSVNGVDLIKNFYQVESGSTIITLLPNYLNQLYTGKYTLAARFIDKNGIEKILSKDFNITGNDDTYKIPEREKVYIVEDLSKLDDINNQTVTRKVIIALDTSASMTDESISKAKEAAKKLTDKLLENKNTTISIASFDVFTIISDFSSSKEEVYNQINNTFVNEFYGPTNYYDLFEQVDKKFKKENQDFEKVLIFMSDGIPTDGPTDENGEFSKEVDHKNFDYANSVVKLKDSFNGAYNIYTIGYLGNLNDFKVENSLEKEKKFAEKLLKRLSTTGSYTTDNLEDLIEKFGELGSSIIGDHNIGLSATTQFLKETEDNYYYKIVARLSNPNTINLSNIQSDLQIDDKTVAIHSDETLRFSHLEPKMYIDGTWIINLPKKDFLKNKTIEFIISATSEQTPVKKIKFSLNLDIPLNNTIRVKKEELINYLKTNVDTSFLSKYDKEIIISNSDNRSKISNTIDKNSNRLNSDKNIFGKISSLQEVVSTHSTVNKSHEKNSLVSSSSLNHAIEINTNERLSSTNKSSLTSVHETEHNLRNSISMTNRTLPKTGEIDSSISFFGILLSLFSLFSVPRKIRSQIK